MRALGRVACSLKSKVLQSVSRNAVTHYVPLLEFTPKEKIGKFKHCSCLVTSQRINKNNRLQIASVDFSLSVCQHTNLGSTRI
jgi:hypothetical protein